MTRISQRLICALNGQSAEQYRQWCTAQGREPRLSAAEQRPPEAVVAVAEAAVRAERARRRAALRAEWNQVEEAPIPGPDLAALRGAELSFVQSCLAVERVEQRDRHMAARRALRRTQRAEGSQAGWPWWPIARAYYRRDLEARFGPQPYGPAPEFSWRDFGWDEQWTAADEAWYQTESGEAGDSPPPSDSSDGENYSSEDEEA